MRPGCMRPGNLRNYCSQNMVHIEKRAGDCRTSTNCLTGKWELNTAHIIVRALTHDEIMKTWFDSPHSRNMPRRAINSCKLPHLNCMRQKGAHNFSGSGKLKRKDIGQQLKMGIPRPYSTYNIEFTNMSYCPRNQTFFNNLLSCSKPGTQDFTWIYLQNPKWLLQHLGNAPSKIHLHFLSANQILTEKPNNSELDVIGCQCLCQLP